MKQKLYKGSSKIIYASSEDHTFIMSFTDTIKLNNGEIIEMAGKGVLNNNISSFIMSKLDMIGIENHLIEKINMREQLIQSVDLFPIQVSIASVASGRFVKDFGVEEGYVFDQPILDYKVRSNELNYPVANEHQLLQFGWVTQRELTELKNKALRIYDFLTGLFLGIGIRLIECRLEFGRVFNGENFIVMLADEISPDTCLLWNMHNNEKIGFDLIEKDIGLAIKSYHMIEELLKVKK